MTKNRQIILTFLLLTFNSAVSFGQKTPQDLGKFVFDVLKSKNFSALDTLTPKSTDIIVILKNKYPTAKIDTSDRFLKKYEYHDNRFKNICKDLRNDTTEIKMDWEKCTLTKVDFLEKPSPYQDTTKNSKPILINYLTLHIASEASTYILEFKEIYFYKGIWKLGEHVRFKRN